MMARATVLALLKALMILVFTGWVALWILKPTEMWTRKWKGAEDTARGTVFGYYGILPYCLLDLTKRPES